MATRPSFKRRSHRSRQSSPPLSRVSTMTVIGSTAIRKTSVLPSSASRCNAQPPCGGASDTVLVPTTDLYELRPVLNLAARVIASIAARAVMLRRHDGGGVPVHDWLSRGPHHQGTLMRPVVAEPEPVAQFPIGSLRAGHRTVHVRQPAGSFIVKPEVHMLIEFPFSQGPKTDSESAGPAPSPVIDEVTEEAFLLAGEFREVKVETNRAAARDQLLVSRGPNLSSTARVSVAHIVMESSHLRSNAPDHCPMCSRQYSALMTDRSRWRGRCSLCRGYTRDAYP